MPHFPAALVFAGFVDSRPLAKQKLKLSSYTLASLAAAVLELHVNKTIEHQRWDDRPLSDQHVHYAAADAAASLRIHLALLELPTLAVTTTAAELLALERAEQEV